MYEEGEASLWMVDNISTRVHYTPDDAMMMATEVSLAAHDDVRRSGLDAGRYRRYRWQVVEGRSACYGGVSECG